MMIDRRLSIALTLSGALPFYLLAIPGVPLVETLVGDLQRAFLAYGAAIAAFMAGAIWGLCQRDNRPRPAARLLSNVLALLAFASLLLAPQHASLALAIQLATFWLLLAVDYHLAHGRTEAGWYLRLRTAVTAIVSAAYLMALAAF